MHADMHLINYKQQIDGFVTSSLKNGSLFHVEESVISKYIASLFYLIGYQNVYQRRPAPKPSPQEKAKLMSKIVFRGTFIEHDLRH